ncbi:MAG: hypothetical protein ACFFD4_16605 [Candidatus Odinarchaeota archaeon]
MNRESKHGITANDGAIHIHYRYLTPLLVERSLLLVTVLSIYKLFPLTGYGYSSGGVHRVNGKTL